MRDLLLDLKYAVRNLAKAPGFTATVVGTLALGIGLTTTIFVIVNAVLLRPFPFLQEQGRLVAVGATNVAEGERLSAMSYPDFHDVRAQVWSFEAVAAHAGGSVNLATTDGEPERVEGERVTAGLFPMLGVAPIHGRAFRPEEDEPGGPPVVVLSEQLWRRRFGGVPGAIGGSVTLNGTPHTIVGVMPAGFTYPDDAVLWTPLQLSPTANRGSHFLGVEARLKPGVTMAQAAVELRRLAQRLEADYPRTNRGYDFEVAPMREREARQVRPVLMIMLGAVAFVLLIACANVANLLLARAAARRREMAVRTALGAARARLIRQLLTESLLLALGGASLGLLFAAWGSDLIVSVLPADRPFWMQLVFDGRVFAFTGAVAGGTALLFGLAPALYASRSDLTENLKDGSQGGGTSRRHGRIRSLLVVAEVSLSVVLLVGAGLMLRSFWLMRTVDPGFDTRNMLTMNVVLAGSAYDSAAARELFLRRSAEQVAALPGVTAASWMSGAPLSGSNTTTSINLGGRPVERSQRPRVNVRIVHGDAAAVIGMPVLQGRTLQPRDAGLAQPTAMIGRTMAERLWPGEDAVGKRFRFGSDTSGPWITVTAVLGDIQGRRLDTPPENQVYLSYLYWPYRDMTLAVRTSGDPLALAGTVRAALRGIDPGLPVYGVLSMEQVVAQSYWESALFGKLFATFGAIALLLAAVGLYGVVAYGVAQRTREFGVRMALGADVHDVLGLVIRNGMRLTLLGLALGAGAAVGVTSVLRNMLYGVTPRDPATFGAVIAFLTAVALLACWIPARRAARVAPSEALRYE